MHRVTNNAPNIVLVMSDQHRADMMGCAGDAGVLTPSLDRLASEGVRFSRVSCQGPLCMPSRASFMTERYVRDHGVYTNWEEIAADRPTYGGRCGRPGYHTALLGKAHLYRDERVDVAHIDELAVRLEALGFAEVIETGDKFLGPIPTRYTDYLREQACWMPTRSTSRTAATRARTRMGRTRPSASPCGTRPRCPCRSTRTSTRGTGGGSALDRATTRADPFFLFVGFPGPHDPVGRPAEAVERYRGLDISMPRIDPAARR